MALEVRVRFPLITLRRRIAQRLEHSADNREMTVQLCLRLPPDSSGEERLCDTEEVAESRSARATTGSSSNGKTPRLHRGYASSTLADSTSALEAHKEECSPGTREVASSILAEGSMRS